MPNEALGNSSHWGLFTASVESDGLRVIPDADDPDPSALLGNIPASLDPRAPAPGRSVSHPRRT
jgi:biotin/methionine sulfoxide reductase